MTLYRKCYGTGTSSRLRPKSKLIDVILYQDNVSAMLLEKNARMSSTKRTKHIDVRYYYIKDRVAAGDLRLEHCPTKEMWADYFTKPLQGNLFYTLRDLIMNIAPSSEHHSSHRSVLTNDDTSTRTEDITGTDAVEKRMQAKIEVMKGTASYVETYKDGCSFRTLLGVCLS